MRVYRQSELEARVGIEPTNAAFAEPCLTTWLPRHSLRRKQYGSLSTNQVESSFHAPSLSKNKTRKCLVAWLLAQSVLFLTQVRRANRGLLLNKFNLNTTS